MKKTIKESNKKVDNRFTGRKKKITFTARPEFCQEVKKLAYKKDCYQIEILERALESYKREKRIKNRTQITFNPYHKVDFVCDKCQGEFTKETSYSIASNLKQLDYCHTYCVNCVESID